MGTAITTGIVRLSYAHIFEPAADLSGNIKYQATLLVPKSDTKTIKQNSLEKILSSEERSRRSLLLRS